MLKAPISKIATPLKSVKGSKFISENMVVGIADITDLHIKWYNNKLIYSDKKGVTIRNLDTNKEEHCNMINPLPSPDGKSIIFFKKKSDKIILNLLNLKKVNKLLELNPNIVMFVTGYSWSSDSERIAINIQLSYDVSNVKKTRAKLYIINRDTLEQELLLSLTGIIDALSWFPDNNKIVFVKGVNNDFKIQTLDITTKKILTLKQFEVHQWLQPIVSPNSSMMIICVIQVL